METLKKWSTSVVAILLAFIIFWPIGCVLLYLRWSANGGNYNAFTKTLVVCGIGLILFGLTGVLVFISEGDFSGLALAVILFEIPGTICAYFGNKRNKKIKGYKKYLDYISARKKIKIDDLCNKLGIAPDIAINDLTEIINKGIIKGYLTDDELILNNVLNNNPISNVEEYVEVKKETKIVKCKECGAKNTIVVGKTKECEYCGTLLQ